MRVTSTLILAVCLALNANAAILVKRAVSAPVQLCISDITTVNEKLAILKTETDGFTSRALFTGLLAVQNKEFEAEKKFNQSIIDCGAATPTTYTSEEANAIVDVVAKLSTHVGAVYQSFINKRFEFSGGAFWAFNMRQSIHRLSSRRLLLEVELTKKTPSEQQSTLNGYLSKMDESFKSFRASYNNATTLNLDGISPTLHFCADQIIVVNQKLSVIKDVVDTFTSAEGQSGWSSIHSKAQDVESSIAKSVQLCSATSILTPYNFHEESELYSIFAKLSSNLASTLASFQSKKAEFSAISVAPLVKTDIENWFNQTNSLDNYLVKRTATNSLPTVNGYINQIVTSFQSAIATYKA